MAKSQIDENIYNVMRQLVEANFFFFVFFLFKLMLYVVINSNGHVGTLSPFYRTS